MQSARRRAAYINENRPAAQCAGAGVGGGVKSLRGEVGEDHPLDRDADGVERPGGQIGPVPGLVPAVHVEGEERDVVRLRHFEKRIPQVVAGDDMRVRCVGEVDGVGRVRIRGQPLHVFAQREDVERAGPVPHVPVVRTAPLGLDVVFGVLLSENHPFLLCSN